MKLKSSPLFKWMPVMCIVILLCAASVESVDFTVESSFGSDGQENVPPTWAVNIPSLTIKTKSSNFPSSSTVIITAKHQLQDGTVAETCQIRADSNGERCDVCSSPPVNFGVKCDRPDPTSIEITFTLAGLDNTRNLSKILLEAPATSGWNYDADDTLITLRECDLFAFQGAMLADDNACGHDCTKSFSCIPGFVGADFNRSCTATATWDDTTLGCVEACNNTFFNDVAAPADNVIVVVGQTKTFNCATSCPQSFNRTCGVDGDWTDRNHPCTRACSASAITRGTPVGNSLFCGGEDHEFNCNSELVCEATKFTLQCNGSDGTWISTEDNCSKALCNETAIKLVYGQYCDRGNVTNIVCDEPFNFPARMGQRKWYHQLLIASKTDCLMSLANSVKKELMQSLPLVQIAWNQEKLQVSSLAVLSSYSSSLLSSSSTSSSSSSSSSSSA